MCEIRFVLLCVISAIIVHGAPQFDTLSEVFKSCSDLEGDGYEGYKCVLPSSCNEGYIVSNAIQGDLALKKGKINRGSDEIDASSFDCPDNKQPSTRQDNDEYYGGYDDYDENSDEKLICCRDPKYFGKGRAN